MATKTSRITKDLVGKRFGRLAVMAYTDQKQMRDYLVNCLCDCGNMKIIASRHLRDDRTASCGCLSKLPIGVAAKRFMFREYERNARRKGLRFTLSFDNFIKITSSNCFYCGVPPLQSAQLRTKYRFNGNYLFNGIDRRDNESGYVLENCLPCCRICNSAKSDFLYGDFISWLERIVDFRKYKDDYGN